jgi:L-alanine-DL-glutamate epimerase-like enolase superfamily enzyme
LIGQDPFHVELLWDRMYRSLGSFSGHSRGIVPEVISGIDIALWDIMGKDTGKPVHTLLGSYGREWIDCYGSSIGVNPIETRIKDTEEALKAGLTSLKVKIGTGIHEDIQAIKAIRKTVGPDFPLSVDTNCAYTFRDAVRLADALYELGVIWFEEPLRTEDREGYAKLRQATKIPLAAGEGEFTRWGIRDLLQTGGIDIVQPDVARSGGITETRKIAILASVHHTAYAPHIGGSGAICAIASLHLGAAMPNFLTYEFAYHPNPLRDEIVTEPYATVQNLRNGQLPVPDKPGLGIDIDHKVLEKYLVK